MSESQKHRYVYCINNFCGKKPTGFISDVCVGKHFGCSCKESCLSLVTVPDPDLEIKRGEGCLPKNFFWPSGLNPKIRGVPGPLPWICHCIVPP